MSGIDYAKLQKRVAKIMPRVKQGVIQLKRSVPGVVDPEEPWIPVEPQETLITLDATVERRDQAFAKSTMIVERGDVLTISPLGRNAAGETVTIELHDGDELVIDGDTRSITNIKRIPAAGTVVAWQAKVAD